MTDPITRLNTTLEGRYRIERELGEGGMATVYLAHDVRHDRNVALKVLKPELAAVVGAERFLAEIKTTANLQHPHILPLFDSGEADGFLFYVMPNVEGESLRDRLDREKQLPVDEAVGIAVKVAGALQAAHGRGVIHRDIKPANILLAQSEPLVADFGIALAVGSAGGARLTETGLSLGTPHYMSPEQATGDQAVGPAADIYALGCVLYEMLIGEPPFTGGTAQAVLGKIITGEPDRPTEHRRSVPDHVEAVILGALEKLPADRIRTAGDFSSFLQDPSRAAMAPGRRASSTQRAPWGPAWRTFAWTGIGVAVGVGVMTLIPGSGNEGIELPIRELTVELPAYAPMPLTGEAWQDIRSLDIAPDGSFIVFEGVDSSGVRLYRRSMASEDAQAIGGTEGSSYPFISPDGRWVAFFVGDQLKKASLAGGGGVITLGEVVANPFGATWLSDEQILVSELGNLVLFSATSAGSREEIGPCAAGPFNCWQPQLLPGGDLVLLSGYLSNGVYSLSSGTWTPLIEEVRVPAVRFLDPGYLVYFHEPAQLFARTFDVGTLTLGPPIPVLSNVRHYVEGELALSSGGDLVYASGGPAFLGRLTWRWRDGREEPLLFDEQTFGTFSLSPDGQYLAATVYRRVAEIWLYDLLRGEARRLSDDRHSEHPVWSPDGREVAWGTSDADDHVILARSIDGDEIRTLIPHAGLPYSWSPSGLITFIQPEGGNNNDIWIADVETGATEEFFSSEGVDDSAVFSPDGSLVAYFSEVDGTAWEVYVEPYPSDGGRRKLSRGRGYFPRWAPDGRTLYYQGGESGRLFYSVDLSAGIDAAGEPELMFEGPYMKGPGHSFDVAPDGERFLVVKLTDPRETITSLTWIQNFRARVEAMVRAAGGS